MVNTGKPSKGCYMCRARRIKCDEGKPNCMRCQKSKRVCPGYRDAFELKHRDEIKSTKRKVSLLHEKHNLSFSGPPSDYNTSDSELSRFLMSPSWMYGTAEFPVAIQNFDQYVPNSVVTGRTPQGRSSPTAIPSHLSTPLDQQASCFFLSNFVLVPQEGTMTRYLDFLIPLLKTAAPNSPLDLTFSAVALAAFGSRPNSPNLLPRAELIYAQALRAINLALADPEEAVEDTTLASVVLLSIFDQLVATHQTQSARMCHIDGAIALIKARGKQQFKTVVGRNLFLSVTTHMTVQYIAKSQVTDPEVEWWMNHIGQDEESRVVNEINLRVAGLRADTEKALTMMSRTHSNITKVLQLVRRAESIEQEYLDWKRSLPTTWQAQTVAWVENIQGDLIDSMVHPGRVESFSELGIAFAINFCRSCRLVVWSDILRCIAWIGEPQDYRLTSEYTLASQVSSQLIEDIIASIPFFFGWEADGAVPLLARETNFACGINEKGSPIKGVSGLSLLWPLFMASSSDFATPSQRAFLKSRMKAIHQATGMDRADLLGKATFRHPSMYICREGANIPRPDSYTIPRTAEILFEKDNGHGLGPHSSEPSTTSFGSNYTPRYVRNSGRGQDLGYVQDYGDEISFSPDSDYETTNFVMA